jgi:hypothetical protein
MGQTDCCELAQPDAGTSNGDPGRATVPQYGADLAYGGKHSIKVGARSCVKAIP